MASCTERIAPAWADGQRASYRLHGTDRQLIGARHLYFAGNAALQPADVPSLSLLRAGEWLGGGTFRNSLYLDAWTRLGAVPDLHLVVEAAGDLRVRVACAVAGRGVETIAEFGILSATMRAHRFALPSPADLPEGARLFWHIDALEASDVREVAFCTEAAPRREARLAVLLRTFGRGAEIEATLRRFVQAAAASPWHAAILDRIDFWLLETFNPGDPEPPGLALDGLNLRSYTAPNLGGGGNAAHLIQRFLDHCRAEPQQAPGEVLILDDDLSISFESIARYLAFCAYRAQDAICSLPILMQSRPTTVWEDGGLWGRFNSEDNNGLGRSRSLFPTLLKHGTSLDGFDRLDDFGRLNHAEYSTFVFFGLPRAALQRLGLPAAFFLRGDDIELSLRARAQGLALVTNPNLAAWHEPGHSHAQEYMAVLHGAIVNLRYSANDAAAYLRYFEERLHEHAAIGDLEGLAVYQEVLRQLLDADSPVLTPDFAPHYVAAVRRFGAQRMVRLPEIERERLVARTRQGGGQVLPFLHAGYHRPDPGGKPVLLVNESRGEYRELEPRPFADKAAAMQAFIAAMARFETEFDALRERWQARLAACSGDAFWRETLQRHAPATRLRHLGQRERSACPARPYGEAVSSAADPAKALAPASGNPGALPLRELRERMEAELQALGRLRAAAQAHAAAARRTPWYAFLLPRRGAEEHAVAGAFDARRGKKKSAPPLAPLPPDFEPEQYLSLNVDVARAGLDPKTHYMRFGAAEGRRYRRPGEPSLLPLGPKA